MLLSWNNGFINYTFRLGAQIIMLQQIFLIAVCLNFRLDLKWQCYCYLLFYWHCQEQVMVSE